HAARAPPHPGGVSPAVTSGVSLIAPNVELLKSTLGRLKFARLKALIISERNCTDVCSPIRVSLLIETSTVWRFGPIMTFRPAFPNVPESGRANADVLNHWFVVRGPALGSPMRSGRSFNSPVPLVSTLKKGVIGRPLWPV